MRNVYVVKPTLIVVAEDEHKAKDYAQLALINQLQEWLRGFGETVVMDEHGDFPEGVLLHWGISDIAKVGE